MEEKLLRAPGVIPVMATFAFCISGLSLLMPVSSAWVSTGGTNATGAGSVTAVLMAATVATQILAVQRALSKFGWAKVLTAGSLFMGLPSALQVISSDLWLVLLSSALRGIGFGILTVCCSTALTRLVPASYRGRAIGYYGLAAAVPQLIFTPLAPWLVEVLGFRPVLFGGVIAAFGAPFAWRLGALVDNRLPQETTVQDGNQANNSVLGQIWPALLTLTLATAAGGALMTFVSDFSPSAHAASLALLLMMLVAVPTRLYGGTFTDRWGTRLLMTPVLALNALGVGILGYAAATGSAGLLFTGAILTGTGYGFLQSVTMVRALSDVPASRTAAASVAWNANFDLGTGLGGLLLGALATGMGFAGAWWVWASLMLLIALVLGLRDFKSV